MQFISGLFDFVLTLIKNACPLEFLKQSVIEQKQR